MLINVLLVPMVGNRGAVLILLLALCFAVSPLPLVSASEGSWTTLEPMPSSAGIWGRAAVVNGKIYLMGRDVTFEYNPVIDTWTNKTQMPTPRRSFAVAACQNKIYVIGGVVGGAAEDFPTTGINEVYDPATDSWENKTSMPTKRSQLNANVVNGKIYLIGGRTGQAYSTVALNQVYDPETDTWTSKKQIPYPVVDYASAVVDNKIYIVGGQDEFHGPINLNFTQIYDPENDSWSQGTPIPADLDAAAGTATLHAGAGVTSGVMAPKRIYVLGGGGMGIALDQNYIYDPIADDWSSGLPMPTARYNPAVAVVDDLIYVIGGAENFEIDLSVINERYTPLNWIPEFSSWIILPLLFFMTIFIVITKKRLHRLRP
jgi:N-acetylneuraminic acid mutarotase